MAMGGATNMGTSPAFIADRKEPEHAIPLQGKKGSPLTKKPKKPKHMTLHTLIRLTFSALRPVNISPAGPYLRRQLGADGEQCTHKLKATDETEVGICLCLLPLSILLDSGW
jgi:hypothetical protein